MAVPGSPRARDRSAVIADALRTVAWSDASHAPDWRRTHLPWTLAVAFVALYLALAVLSGQLSSTGNVSPWYPPVGLSLTAVLVFGTRAVPLVFVADAVQILVRGQGGVGEALADGVAQAVFWGSAGLLLRPLLQAHSPLSRMRDLAWFTTVAVVVGPAIAAVAGVALIFAMNGTSWHEYSDAVRIYAVGDSIGILSLTPTLLVLSGWSRRPAAARHAVREAVMGRGAEGPAMIAAAIAVPAAVVSLWGGELLPLAPVPIAWVAVRRGMPTVAFGLTVWSLAAVTAYAAGASGTTLREISALLISTGVLSLSIGAVVTERERGRARLAYLALHDDLTGLPNRRGFTQSVADALGRTHRDDIAVLHIRLGMLTTSEAVPPATVDAILLRAAHRLRRLTSPDATIARVGLGRFVVLLDGPDARRVDDVASVLLEGLERPARIDGHEYLFGPMIGAAMGDGADDPERMLDHAQRAAEVAQAQTGQHAVYDDAMRDSATASRELSVDLLAALVADRLHLHFQPIIAMASGRAIGVEALLRWTDETRGEIGPNEFIPVAEACGLILPIGRWVLRKACVAATGWPSDAGDPGLVVHVNLSPVQLRDEGFVRYVSETLAETGLPAERLCLELTESALVDDLDVAAARIQELAAIGVQVVLDDFGTGASSLSWLQRLPVTALKVDRSFVSGIEARPVDLAIVTATLGLAQAMGLETVAEGVETQEQLETLRGLGCASVQGYLTCRPISADDLAAWLLAPAVQRPGVKFGAA